MPWYVRLFRPVAEKLGEVLVKNALSYLESKFPQSRDIFELIIGWLEDEQSNGNVGATNQLRECVHDLCDK